MEYFAGLRKDAVSSWQSFFMQHTYRAPLVHEGWPRCSPEVCPARAALERRSRGCASCQTEQQWPCASWQSSWGHKSLSDACSVQTEAPATFREVSGGWLTPQLSGPRQKPKPRVLAFTWELLHRQSKLNTPITKRDRGFFGWDCFQKRWTSLKILVFISFTVYSTVYCKNIHLLLFMWTKVSEGKCTNRSAHNPAPCFKMESFTTLVKIRCRPQLRRYMYICIYMKETDIWLWFSGKWSVSLSKVAAREARLLVFNLGSLYWVCIFMQSFGKLGVAVMKKKVSIKKFR